MAGPKHTIHDTDEHFIIDPITRAIKNETHKKISIVICDHNSEVFTFSLPRHIEGHDMAKCNKVEIHFVNTHSTTKEKSADRYKVADFAVSPTDPEKILFSWTLDDKTTKYPGPLAFACHFNCIDELTEEVHYQWSTAANNTITVLDSIDLTPPEGEEATDLQEKTATPTKSTQVVSPDGSFRGLRRVVIEPIPDEYIIPTGTLLVDANGDYAVRDFDKVIVNVPEVPPVLQDKEITANGEYTPDGGFDGFRRVTVDVENAPTLQEKIAYPATSQQAIVADAGYDGISKVTIEPVRLQDKTVRRNGQVIPDMGFMGMDTVTVDVQPVLQDKTINVNGSGRVEVIADSGYDGLEKVTVNASVPQPMLQTKKVTKNGEVIPDSGYDGLSRVTVDVQPRMQAKSVSISASMQVEVLPDRDFDGLEKVTITTNLPERDLQSKSVNIDKRGKTDIIPDSGYYGLSKVTINADFDPDLQKKTVKPSTSRQTVTPDSNYDGLGEVVVEPVQLQRKTITKNGEFGADTAYGYLGLEQVTVDVEPDLQSKTVKPSASRQTVTPDDNYDGLGEVVVEPIQLQTKTITANGEYRADTAYGYSGLEKVTVKVEPELQSKSLKITQNGSTEVIPDSGYYGLEKLNVTVAVDSAPFIAAYIAEKLGGKY